MQVNVKTVLFQTIQFSILNSLVLFDPLIGPYQVLLLWARVDLEAIAIKGYYAFFKAPALHPKIVKCHIRTLVGWVDLTPPQRSSWCILQPQQTGQCLIKFSKDNNITVYYVRSTKCISQ